MNMRVAEIARAIGARLPDTASPDVVIESVCSDSRKACPGSLFVCLPGERVDGHDYAQQAANQGASLIIAARPLPEITDTPVLVVENPLTALGQLARAWRDKTQAKVIAITGSCGKTTVKEMIASVLSLVGQTSKNHKNFNNQLGLPLSILAASDKDAFWVMELGISRPGDMEELGSIAAPDIAVLHNVGSAHLEGLGDLNGVIEAKTRLFDYLAPNGIAIVSKDYPGLVEKVQSKTSSLVTISTTDPSADILCTFVASQGHNGTFAVTTQTESRTMTFGLAGAHYAENIAAVCAVCQVLSIRLDHIEKALKQFKNPDQRFVVETIRNISIIDDSYNANPLSMKRSIEAAKTLAGDRPLCLLLGEMRELGTARQAEHIALGIAAAKTHPKLVLFKGESTQQVEDGLKKGGFTGTFLNATEPQELSAILEDLTFNDGIILVKGSRSMAMETYVHALRDTLIRSTM